jgi:hypothetical protein
VKIGEPVQHPVSNIPNLGNPLKSSFRSASEQHLSLNTSCACCQDYYSLKIYNKIAK